MAFTLVTSFVIGAIIAASSVNAETHTISFTNNCGKGTPQLILGGNVISTGEPYTHTGVFSSAIAYLQTGPCLFNGENCALLEMSLQNPGAAAGSGSSTDISLITPHELNVPVGFNYYNGCDGVGTSCLTSNCKTAFFQPDDTTVQVACQADNVNLMITFCPNGATSSPTSSSTSKHTTTSTTATHTSTSSTVVASTTPVHTTTASPTSVSVIGGLATSSSASASSASASASGNPRKSCSSTSKRRKAARNSSLNSRHQGLRARQRRGDGF